MSIKSFGERIADVLIEDGLLLPAQLAEAIEAVRATTFTSGLLPCIVVIYLKAALCGAFTLLLSTFATSWIFTIIVSVVVLALLYNRRASDFFARAPSACRRAATPSRQAAKRFGPGSP